MLRELGGEITRGDNRANWVTTLQGHVVTNRDVTFPVHSSVPQTHIGFILSAKWTAGDMRAYALEEIKYKLLSQYNVHKYNIFSKHLGQVRVDFVQTVLSTPLVQR